MRTLSAAIVFLATQAQPCGTAAPECDCPCPTETAPRPESRPIAAVPTAIAGFVGHTENAVSGVVVVTSMKEFQATFGGADPMDRGFALHPSMRMFFANGGTDARVVSVGTFEDDPTRGGFEAGLGVLEASDATLVAVPDAAAVLPVGELHAFHASLMSHCADLQDRFCLLDLPNGPVDDDVDAFRAAFSVADPSWGAAYVPWLQTTDGTVIPPSAAMAGVMTRVDRANGVWKAPANVSVVGATGLTADISTGQQESLNVDADTGLSINAIRAFTGQGILVWGARTLAGNDPEWRYVSGRRLGVFLEQSLVRGLDWVVFEPNDEPLWADVRVRVDAFLSELWRDGALVGPTPDEAYFVNVGLGESMTQADVDAGRVIVRVGFAPLRPAEFVVMNLVLEPPKP